MKIIFWKNIQLSVPKSSKMSRWSRMLSKWQEITMNTMTEAVILTVLQALKFRFMPVLSLLLIVTMPWIPVAFTVMLCLRMKSMKRFSKTRAHNSTLKLQIYFWHCSPKIRFLIWMTFQKAAVQLMILSQHKCRNSSISSVWPFPKMSKSEVLRFPPESVCAQPVITLKTVTRKRIKLYIMSNRTVKISSSSISRLTVKNFLPPVLAKIFSS